LILTYSKSGSVRSVKFCASRIRSHYYFYQSGSFHFQRLLSNLLLSKNDEDLPLVYTKDTEEKKRIRILIRNLAMGVVIKRNGLYFYNVIRNGFLFCHTCGIKKSRTINFSIFSFVAAFGSGIRDPVLFDP
jgi:hypothetical protein